ncbi:MAG: tRNA/rRNA methyltransferase (spou) [Candidatus Peregrinibacteria bacterium GW2011_GWC2_33_13]|nr:MAG: tRNA/rRNA methyltransferase (spou) [Candidatus Peregrinibacteria bacterium GW2011_GWC2_33_13]
MTSKTPIVAILENIRSLHNVGAIFRTADASNIERIYLCGYTGIPPRKEITKTALGAEEYVEWVHDPDIISVISTLQKGGYEIIALEKTADSRNILDIKKYKSPIAIIVGNEIEGISEAVLNISDKVLHIPMLGKKESLNVSTAFGIGVYQILNKI